MNWKFFLTLGARVLASIIGILSPEIRTGIEEAIRGLYVKAKATDNPIDNMFVETLATMLRVDLSQGA